MAATESASPTRKALGAWSTPPALVDVVIERAIDATFAAGRTVTVLDPACGDGRFLAAAGDRIRRLGGEPLLIGMDVDARALDAARRAGVTDLELLHGDALAMDWSERRFDLVVGNPPFLSQLASATTRGGASRLGGGPYADAAIEFLALAMQLARPDAGRIGLVLPQSVLASRDAGPVRAEVGRLATMSWSWWSPALWFDAAVRVCALGFERPAAAPAPAGTWAHVVTDALGVPPLPEALRVDGSLGDRAELNANFRDEYYGLVPAVRDGGDGPPLVTSGLIDAARCEWGNRPVRFAKRTFAAPAVDLDRLDPRMSRWARRKLVPKVLVASQTRRIEAVADVDGRWLPGVPVTTAVPAVGTPLWELAAVLTSPIASVAAWHRAAGTGLSAQSLRVGPDLLGGLPWPAGDVRAATAALRAGDVVSCGREVMRAFGVRDAAAAEELMAWWSAGLPSGTPTM